MKNDINLIPPRAHRIGLIDARLMEQWRLVEKAREQGLRDLAAPYLRAGYLPCELTAVERRSELFDTREHMYVCVRISRKRSAVLLWFRRVMLRLHLRRPYSGFREGLPWHG